MHEPFLHQKPPLMVGALMERLSALDRNMPVVAEYDCGCAEGAVVSVNPRTGADPSVVLIVE